MQWLCRQSLHTKVPHETGFGQTPEAAKTLNELQRIERLRTKQIFNYNTNYSWKELPKIYIYTQTDNQLQLSDSI